MCPNCGYCPTCGRSSGWGVTPFYPHFPITPTPWYVHTAGTSDYDYTLVGTNTDVQTSYTDTCSDSFHTNIAS